jgi:probable F420-dependent oxidoreductase
MPGPFRFTVQAHTARSGAEWASIARRAEALGYDALYMPDHTGRQLSPFTALTAAALATRTLRIGAFVFANDYRHPLLLARDLATLDLISDGRLDVGIGAGWARPDYAALGITYGAPRVRVDRMIEAVRLLKRLWAGGPVDHTGRHYRLRGAELAPAPVQRPFPPLLIGAGGPRMLAFAAREADIVALAPRVRRSGWPALTDLGVSGTAAKVARVREAAGDRWERLELNAIVFDVEVAGSLGSPLRDAAARVKSAIAALADTPFFLYGSPGRIRDDLVRRRERFGISHITTPAASMEAFAPVVKDLRGT